ncbi:MAG: CRISPR-associated protein Csx1 [Archaeoglobaceae archaeon]|nr:CRISPR-associated protein Csx1 [Archaeoglobaceae archaeon]MDK2876248.1 CRISPR-associated protein Csx1 [Archaeoglobaceae archaeon]
MIVQICGDPKQYSKVNFKIGEKEVESCFCSEVLRELRNEEVVLFAPKSLIEKNEIGSIEVLKDKISEKGLKSFEIFEIPSVGIYGERRYYAKFDDVLASIFLKIFEKRPKSILVDPSTGQNFYSIALLEAVRSYATYRKLERILQDGGDFEAKMVSYPPIIRDLTKTAEVEFHKIPAKAFFSFPENTNLDEIIISKNAKAKEEIGKKYHNSKSDFRKLLIETKIAFNAIRYNVPLAFYELVNFEFKIDDIERSIFEMAKEVVEREVNLRFVVLSEVFYVTAMAKSFQEFKKSLSEPCTDEIKEKFSEVYKKVGLDVNGRFLERDISEIKGELKNKKVGEKGKLKEIKGTKGSSDIERNFFAHSGFLYEYTEFEIKEQEICLYWIKDKHREIKNWFKKLE